MTMRRVLLRAKVARGGSVANAGEVAAYDDAEAEALVRRGLAVPYEPARKAPDHPPLDRAVKRAPVKK